MKKLFALVCVLLMLSLISGCTFILGGNNRRELGEFVLSFTDGESDYIEFPLTFDDCVVKKSAEGYSLIKDATLDEAVLTEKTSAKLVLQAYTTALNGGAFIQNGYDYLYEALDSSFDIVDDSTYCEVVMLEKDEEIYGALNFYNRVSGRSGSLLSNEDLTKSVFVNYRDGEIVTVKELDETAILAFDKSELIIYRDKSVIAFDIQSEEEAFLLKDLWWDNGPTFYNRFKVKFNDETFIIYGNDDDGKNNTESLFAGSFGSKEIVTLMDKEKVEY